MLLGSQNLQDSRTLGSYRSGRTSLTLLLGVGLALSALTGCSESSNDGANGPSASGGVNTGGTVSATGGVTPGTGGATTGNGGTAPGGSATGGGNPVGAGAGGGDPSGGTGGSGSGQGGTSAGNGGSPSAGSGGTSEGGTNAGQAGKGGQSPAGGQAGQVGQGGNAGASAQATCAEMVSAAEAFIDGLGQNATLRADALMAYSARTHFKFTPGDRPGLPLADMTEQQRTLALALLSTGLSEKGFTKAEVTRQNELILRAQENSDSRDPLGYFIAIYGTPATTGAWAWHWEGHHLSLHFTLSDCVQIATAPTFYGANPARVNTSVAGAPAMGTRNLGGEEDLGRELAAALDMDATKRSQAIVASQLRDTPETTSVMPVEPRGLLASAMSATEQDMLRALIAEYANNLAPELAAERLARVEDEGLDDVSFLWSGSLMTGQAHYYRVQGPSFMIEYVNEQNNANHVHAVWRDFSGDYGRDLIAEHRLLYPH